MRSGDLADLSFQLIEPAPALSSSRDILKLSSYCSCETSASWPPTGLLTVDLRAHAYLQVSQASPCNCVVFCVSVGGGSRAAHLSALLRSICQERAVHSILILRAREPKTGPQSSLCPYKSQTLPPVLLALLCRSMDQAGSVSSFKEALLLPRPDQLALSHPGTQV